MRYLLTVIILSGCTGIVPSTAARLNALDPLTADPADMAVALELPNGLGVLPDSVKLLLGAENATRGKTSGEWVLSETTDAEGRLKYAIAAQDQSELRAIQAQVRGWEAADPDGTEGYLSVAIGGCRTVPAEKLQNARGSVFIALSPDAPMMPLFRNAPITKVLSDQDLADMPPCPDQ